MTADEEGAAGLGGAAVGEGEDSGLQARVCRFESTRLPVERLERPATRTFCLLTGNGRAGTVNRPLRASDPRDRPDPPGALTQRVGGKQVNTSSMSPDAAAQVQSAFELSGYTYDDADVKNAGNRRKVAVGDLHMGKVAERIYNRLRNHHVFLSLKDFPGKGADLITLFNAAWDEDVLLRAGVGDEAMKELDRATSGLSALNPGGHVFQMALNDGLLLCQGTTTVGDKITYRFLSSDDEVVYKYNYAYIKLDLKRAYDRIGKKFQPILDVCPSLEKRMKKELGNESVSGQTALEARSPHALGSGAAPAMDKEDGESSAA